MSTSNSIDNNLRFKAGFDVSRRTHGGQTIHVAALALVSNASDLDVVFDRACNTAGVPNDHVFHAHDDKPDEQIALIETVMASRIDWRVLTVTAVDSNPIAMGLSVVSFYERSAEQLVRRAAQFGVVTDYALDRDLSGTAKNQAVKKRVRRAHAAVNLGRRCAVHFPSSKDNRIIQLADVFGYGVCRLVSGAKITGQQRELLARVIANIRYSGESY